jgi:hypothetical protein
MNSVEAGSGKRFSAASRSTSVWTRTCAAASCWRLRRVLSYQWFEMAEVHIRYLSDITYYFQILALKWLILWPIFSLAHADRVSPCDGGDCQSDAVPRPFKSAVEKPPAALAARSGGPSLTHSGSSALPPR